MIGIINYGMGNIQSVVNSLGHLEIANRVVTEPAQMVDCERFILPGVGAFGAAMRKLRQIGFVKGLEEQVIEQKKPLLGICLGMQLLFESSEEYGHHRGLALARGRVESLGERVKDRPIPHVGWNEVERKGDSVLLKGIDRGCFYFVHSFYCRVADRTTATGVTEYGITFDSVLEAGNIFGCQFHPEKSQKDGLVLLNNFANL